MLHPHLTRQLEILPPDVAKNTPVTIIGAGAIGSFTTLALAKMGFEDLTVYDDDEVTIENMNCQFYRKSDVGKLKVEALQNLVGDFTDVIITAREKRYGLKADTPAEGIIISAVDSMASRKAIWELNKETVQCKLYIDPRMGAESALCYAVKPLKPGTYEKTLYTDAEAVQEPCTAKATMYTACMLSGHVCKIVKDFVTGNDYARTTQWAIDKDAFIAHRTKEHS